MTIPKFTANPHALFTNGVCTDVVYMQDYSPEEIEETLSKYSYDKVIRWEDHGYEIYVGQYDYETFYAFKPPYDSWNYNTLGRTWMPPVKHPWEAEFEQNVTLQTEYKWDEELVDWVPVGTRGCCNPDNVIASS